MTLASPEAGSAKERTALAWWRTAQTAIACALLIAKLATDRTVAGWVSTGLAVAIAVVAWLAARRRVRDDADVTRPPAPLPAPLLGLAALTVLLAGSVLVSVVITSGSR